MYIHVQGHVGSFVVIHPNKVLILTLPYNVHVYYHTHFLILISTSGTCYSEQILCIHAYYLNDTCNGTKACWSVNTDCTVHTPHYDFVF